MKQKEIKEMNTGKKKMPDFPRIRLADGFISFPDQDIQRRRYAEMETALVAALRVLESMNHMSDNSYCVCALNDGGRPNEEHATFCAQARAALDHIRAALSR